MTRALLGKAPAHDNHRLLLYHDNGSLQYDYHTIGIIVHHYFPLHGIHTFISEVIWIHCREVSYTAIHLKHCIISETYTVFTLA